jgi:hypothetical protein
MPVVQSSPGPHLRQEEAAHPQAVSLTSRREGFPVSSSGSSRSNLGLGVEKNSNEVFDFAH